MKGLDEAVLAAKGQCILVRTSSNDDYGCW